MWGSIDRSTDRHRVMILSYACSLCCCSALCCCLLCLSHPAAEGVNSAATVQRATVQLQRSKTQPGTTGFSKTGDRTCRNSLPFHCIMPKASSPNFDVMCPDSFIITESTIDYRICDQHMTRYPQNFYERERRRDSRICVRLICTITQKLFVQEYFGGIRKDLRPVIIRQKNGRNVH